MIVNKAAQHANMCVVSKKLFNFFLISILCVLLRANADLTKLKRDHVKKKHNSIISRLVFAVQSLLYDCTIISTASTSFYIVTVFKAP